MQRIFKQNPIEVAYLFGSQSNKTANKESDVDIAIVSHKNLSKQECFALRLKLISAFNKIFQNQTDVVMFNDLKSIFFKYVILSEGKLLYEKSESTRVDLECQTLSAYFDFAPFLDIYNQEYIKNNI